MSRKYFKATATLITIMLFACLLTAPAAAGNREELELSAVAAALIEAETSRVLYATANANKPMAPASLTKIMTLLIAMEELKKGNVSWDTPITTSKKAWETGGSTMFLNHNQVATFEELIKGITIVSANDACVSVAEHLYGSEAAFVQQMNRRAQELGLENTHFVNSHGMDHPDHYMSALDVARLAAYFVQTQPEAAVFQSEREFTFNDIMQYNLNPLLDRFPGADGIKTGSTPQAGMCLAASCKRDGMRLVSVVLNAPSDDARREDSEVLLNYGFRNYRLLTLVDQGEPVESVPVKRGTKRTLNLTAAGRIVAVAARNENPDTRLVSNITRKPAAPIEAGEKIGTLEVFLNGEKIGETELLAAEPVEKLGFFASIWRSIGDFFTGLWRRGRGLD